jgi:hypothetical protein
MLYFYFTAVVLARGASRQGSEAAGKVHGRPY